MKAQTRLAASLALAMAVAIAVPAGAATAGPLDPAPTVGTLDTVGTAVTAVAPAPTGTVRRVLRVSSLPGVATLRTLTATEEQALLRTAPVPAGAVGVVATSFAALGDYAVVSDVTGNAEVADAWVRVIRLRAGATQGEVLAEGHGRRTADDSSDMRTDAQTGPVKDPTYQQGVASECPTEPVIDQLLKCAAFLYAAYRAGQAIGYNVYEACRQSADNCDEAFTIVGAVVQAGCDFTRPPNPGPWECYYGNLEMYFENTFDTVCLTGPSCRFQGRGEPGVTRNCALCSPIYVSNRLVIVYDYATPDGTRPFYWSGGGLNQSGGMAHMGYGVEFDSFFAGWDHNTYECATDVTLYWDVYWNDGSSGTAYVNPRGQGKYMTNGRWEYAHEPARSCLGLPG